MPRFASEQRFGGLLQTECVERFDDPALGTTASCEMYVGVTVKKHQHGNVRDALVAVIESEIHRHRHCPHRPELQVEHGKIGDTSLDGLRDIATVRADHEGVLWGPEGSDDFIEHPLCVGSNENVHVCRLLQRRH